MEDDSWIRSMIIVIVILCVIGGFALTISVDIGDSDDQDDGSNDGSGDDDQGDVIQIGDYVPVSMGTSITFFEYSGETMEYEMLVDDMIEGSEVISTWGHETYLLMSDGNTLTIYCHRDAYSTGMGVGGNIVAVRLNGVQGCEDGLWAAEIINHSLGYNGIEESLENALGDLDRIGPYGGSTCTYMGDQYSSMTIAFKYG